MTQQIYWFVYWSHRKYRSYDFTIAQRGKILNQTNNNDLKIITAKFKYSILAVAAKKQFHVILEDNGNGITILNNSDCLLLATDFVYSMYFLNLLL